MNESSEVFLEYNEREVKHHPREDEKAVDHQVHYKLDSGVVVDHLWSPSHVDYQHSARDYKGNQEEEQVAEGVVLENIVGPETRVAWGERLNEREQKIADSSSNAEPFNNDHHVVDPVMLVLNLAMHLGPDREINAHCYKAWDGLVLEEMVGLAIIIEDSVSTL